MSHGNGAAGLGVAVQPMENQRLQYQLGIGQMTGTILFKGFKEFSIKPIGSLAGQGFADTLDDLYWFVSLGHNEQSLHSSPSLGKLRIRPCRIRPHSCATLIVFNNDIDVYNDSAILCSQDVRVARLGLCVFRRPPDSRGPAGWLHARQ